MNPFVIAGLGIALVSLFLEDRKNAQHAKVSDDGNGSGGSDPTDQLRAAPAATSRWKGGVTDHPTKTVNQGAQPNADDAPIHPVRDDRPDHDRDRESQPPEGAGTPEPLNPESPPEGQPNA